jgi:hypothetical protein
MTPSDALQILDALRHSTGRRTLAVSLASDWTDRLVARIVPCATRGVDTPVAMSFGEADPSFIADARQALRAFCPAGRPMAWLHDQHAWIGADDPDGPCLLLPLRGGRRPPPKAKPTLWATAKPLVLPALAALPHGGRWRLPLAPSAHARLATGLTTAAIEAMADAFGPALGGANAIDIVAQHRLVALRPVGPRFPLAVLHLPGQPGAPRLPSLRLEAA